MSQADSGGFASNEYVLLAFFGLSTLAFLWYMYKVIVEYQNMDPKDFDDDASEEQPEVELQDFTLDELKQYNGKNDMPIFLAVRGFVFDVTAGRDFYGPGGAYEVLAGRDASLGLAVMDTDESKWPQKTSMDELTGMETDTLNDWLQRFEDKYSLVGFLPEGFDGRTLAEMTAAAQAQAEAEFEAAGQEAEATALAAAGSDEEGDDAQLRSRVDGERTYADAAAAAVEGEDADKPKAE